MKGSCRSADRIRVGDLILLRSGRTAEVTGRSDWAPPHLAIFCWETVRGPGEPPSQGVSVLPAGEAVPVASWRSEAAAAWRALTGVARAAPAPRHAAPGRCRRRVADARAAAPIEVAVAGIDAHTVGGGLR